ncbi:putative UspA domain protein [metagenome]|uniref:Putative UspA domain protein n=1 Tax=metagenome TaxID=256318 RepID=A0A2P2C910_9ZZZZ
MPSQPIGPVVVGVDGAPWNRVAIEYAAREAEQRGTGVRLVHVIPTPVPRPPLPPVVPAAVRSAGLGILQHAHEAAHTVAPTVEVTTGLARGPVVEALLRAAEGASAVVLGHGGDSSRARLWTGSTLTGVSARAACPTVAVPASWVSASRHGRVVVGYHSPQHSDELLTPAFEEAARRKAELVVLHAWTVPSGYADVIEVRTHADDRRRTALAEIESQLDAFEATFPEVSVRVEVVHGQPAHALVAASRTADLLVLGRGRSLLPPRHVGGTARAVLREGACPVEIMPSSLHSDLPELTLEEHGALLP